MWFVTLDFSFVLSIRSSILKSAHVLGKRVQGRLRHGFLVPLTLIALRALERMFLVTIN